MVEAPTCLNLQERAKVVAKSLLIGQVPRSSRVTPFSSVSSFFPAVGVSRGDRLDAASLGTTDGTSCRT